MANVGRVIVVERGGHGDQENVGWFDRRRGPQQSACDDPLNQRIEVDFVDMDLSGVDGIDD
jgi:hypothetical protein